MLSLNVYSTAYNYFDFRFHWSPLDISYFFATFNASMAIAGGWAIRYIVPKRLSVENGVLFGFFLQVGWVDLRWAGLGWAGLGWAVSDVTLLTYSLHGSQLIGSGCTAFLLHKIHIIPTGCDELVAAGLSRFWLSWTG